MFSFAGLLAKQRRHPASMFTFLWVKTGEAGFLELLMQGEKLQRMPQTRRS